MQSVVERASVGAATELHVFDFDDTLFASPPPPKDWTGKESDWWRSAASLSPPYVAVGKEREGALAAVQTARASFKNPLVHAVLITGRPDDPALRARITSILKALGLDFDGVYLKDQGDTAKYKARIVESLLARMPGVKTVAMWDDWQPNLDTMSAALKKRGTNFMANKVRTKSYTEQRQASFDTAVGYVEGKAYKIGTVRKWSDGDYIKTDKGWVPVSGAKSKASAGGGAPTPAPTGAAPTGGKVKVDSVPSSRKKKTFDLARAGKVLAAVMADPTSDKAQANARKVLNRLCEDFGMMNRDGDTLGSERYELRTKEQLPPGVGGIHEWNGKIVVRDKYNKRAAALMEALAGGKPAPEKGVAGMRVLVHEAVHGHSPIRQDNFKGRYRLLEEATTELAARKVMRDAFGASWEELNEKGSYGLFCGAVYSGVSTALKRNGVEVAPDSWHDFLGEAAVEMRRRPPKTDPDKNAYLKRFAESLPLSADAKAAGGAALTKEVAGAVWLALKPAKEEEKLYRVKAAFQAGQADGKAVLAQAKAVAMAKKDWEDYVAGGPLKEAVAAVLLALLGEKKAPVGEDTGMLPRNDIDAAIAYARVLSEEGKLTGAAIRDLALLQDDVDAALTRLAAAIDEYALVVVEETPTIVDGLKF